MWPVSSLSFSSSICIQGTQTNKQVMLPCKQVQRSLRGLQRQHVVFLCTYPGRSIHQCAGMSTTGLQKQHVDFTCNTVGARFSSVQLPAQSQLKYIGRLCQQSPVQCRLQSSWGCPRGCPAQGGVPVTLLPPSNLAVRGRIFTSRPPATQGYYISQTNGWTDRQTDKQTDTQTDTQTDRPTDTDRQETSNIEHSGDKQPGRPDMCYVAMPLKVHKVSTIGGIAPS